MSRQAGDRIVRLGDSSPERLKEVADLLDALGGGQQAQLGAFGDNVGAATPADEQAAIIYELAATLRAAGQA